VAIHRLTEADLAHLHALLDQMRRAAEAADPFAEATADAQFHAYILHRAGNATMERVWRTLEPFLRTYITIVSPGVDRRAVADRHLHIIDALRSGDEDTVTRAFEVHFETAARSLAERWPQRRDGGDVSGEGRAAAASGTT
jgi:DNA-binding GntR family transcriptional regulator